MLPLLQVLWKNPEVEGIVTFVSRQPTTREVAHATSISHRSNDTQTERAKKMQKILHALGVQDMLELKRWAYKNALGVQHMLELKRWAYRDALGTRLIIQPDLESGIVITRYTDDSRDYKWFYISTDGIATWKMEEIVPHTLSNLNSFLREKILALAAYSSNEVEFDLSAHRVYGVNQNVFQWERWLRDDAPSVPHSTSLKVTMTTEKVITDFDNFQTFEEQLNRSPPCISRCPNVFSRILRSSLWDHPSAIIVLNFNISTATSLEEIRVNTKSFILSPFPCSRPARTRIQFKLKCPWGRGVHCEETLVSLKDFHERLFLLVSDMLRNWPKDIPAARAAQYPDFWVNGKGTLISALYPALAESPAYSVEYRHGLLTQAEVRCRGYNRATGYDDFGDDLRSNWGEKKLVRLWSYLRDTYWRDWEEPRVLSL
jgi:hypothetical protein